MVVFLVSTFILQLHLVVVMIGPGILSALWEDCIDIRRSI